MRRTLVILVVGIAMAHLFGLAFRNGHFWGVDALGSYGPWVAIPSLLAVLAVTAFVLTGRSARAIAETAAAEPPPDARDPEWVRVAIPAGLALAGGALFWMFRAAHVFLGDGIVMVTTLPAERAFHPLEPLSMLLEQAVYDLLSPGLGRSGQPPHRMAWDSAAVVSVAAGTVFLPVVWSLARRLARRVGDGAPSRRTDPLVTGLVTLVVLLQGYVQVFFGYVEVYALTTTSIALYLLAALRFIEDRAPLWYAAAALALAIGFHLSALALLPSLAVLIGAAVSDPRRRRDLARDMLLSGAAFVVLAVALGLIGRGYHLGDTVVSLVGALLARQPEPIPGYFLSWRHARDFVNGQLLVGPLGFFLFVPVAIGTLRAAKHRGLAPAFLLALGGGFAVVCVIAGDSTLGYARNWDLLAPAGFVLAVAALGLALRLLPGRATARALLVVALAVSCAHTVPWIAMNASFARSLERFATLRLGLGRVESTVGYWYSLQGNNAEAERWLGRALDRYPGNVRAHVFLGDLYAQRGQHALACTAFRVAVQLRPESDEYRLRLVSALVNSGAPAIALPEVENLLERQPESPRIWTVYGIVLLGAGRGDQARRAFDQARRHAPASLLYRLMEHYADLPRGFERALDDVWPVLMSG